MAPTVGFLQGNKIKKLCMTFVNGTCTLQVCSGSRKTYSKYTEGYQKKAKLK